MRVIMSGLCCWFASSVVVAVSVLLSRSYIAQQLPSSATVSGLIRFDGSHYREIAQNGYDYDVTSRSTVAFFPAYPLAARCFARIVGCSIDDSLLAISNIFLAIGSMLFALYLRCRANLTSQATADWAQVTFAFWPAAMFYHFAYAESLLVVTAVLTLIAIQRRWPLVLAAFIAGVASATRPVGIAVSAALCWSVISNTDRALRSRLPLILGLVPLSVWGLLDFMMYQQLGFGNALAFCQTQSHWTRRMPVPDPTITEKITSLCSLEPIWGAYDPSSPRYWASVESGGIAIFNLHFWNPVLFIACSVLVAVGAYRAWLTGPEIVLGVGLLLIPYVTRAYEMSMASHARFSIVVVPMFIVLGRLLASWPQAVSAALCALSACLMMCWTALYVAGYPFF